MTREEAIEFLKNMIDRESIGFVCPKGDGDVAVWEYHVTALNMAIKALEQPEIIRCRECRYSYMTYDDKCKYCDIWFPDEKCYMDGDYFCASAERRGEGGE